MQYDQKAVSGEIAHFVKWFWMIESDDSLVKEQKIIPDGYPELIFHFGSPYEICFEDKWETQALSLLAGQIKHHFYLRNTGSSKMFGIKFQPWAMEQLFNVEMDGLTNRVIELPEEISARLCAIKAVAISNFSFEEKVNKIESEVENLRWEVKIEAGQRAVQEIIDRNGLISVSEITKLSGLSERSLERYFKFKIGVSPKFYCRIIRLSHIFKLAQEGKKNWAELAYRAGFFDQTHFIKNFKEFTGEDPSKYGFDESNMANFFLK